MRPLPSNRWRYWLPRFWTIEKGETRFGVGRHRVGMGIEIRGRLRPVFMKRCDDQSSSRVRGRANGRYVPQRAIALRYRSFLLPGFELIRAGRRPTLKASFE